jgi:hypothetical protein
MVEALMNKADDISMSEKRRILAEEEISSYRAHAQANADFDLGGRYALVQKPATVIGSGPISYPKLPEDSPSNQLAMMPPEPPLGYSVNAQDPVGEQFEQEASKSTARRGWRRL